MLETADRIDLHDELIRYFKPIEQLFRIMNAVDPGVHGALVISCSEIGLRLSENFLEQLERLLEKGEDQGGGLEQQDKG